VTAGKVLMTALKILVVCLVFALCLVVGGALSGLHKIGQQAPPAQQAISSEPQAAGGSQAPQMPENLLLTFLIFSVCAGVVLSYLILRSSWHGWPLVGAISVGMYGASTVGPQLDSVFFLSNKLPRGLIQALFLQGAIATALFSPLAVLLLGKWRAVSGAPAFPRRAQMRATSAAWRLALLVVAFVVLYMFFGYYVAWQSPAVRQYYGGQQYLSFYATLKGNWNYHRLIYPFQVFRALVYIACLYPLVRMLRVARWEMVLAMALFLSVWTTALLLPNSMMPASVAHTHLWETLGFSLVFGALAGWLLTPPQQAVTASDSAAS
jgi:hypothetical protein